MLLEIKPGQILNYSRIFSFAGLVADSFGGYPPAFYMSGALVALSGVIVLLVLFVKQDHQDPAEAAIRGALLVVEKCTVV